MLSLVLSALIPYGYVVCARIGPNVYQAGTALESVALEKKVLELVRDGLPDPDPMPWELNGRVSVDKAWIEQLDTEHPACQPPAVN